MYPYFLEYSIFRLFQNLLDFKTLKYLDSLNSRIFNLETKFASVPLQTQNRFNVQTQL